MSSLKYFCFSICITLSLSGFGQETPKNSILKDTVELDEIVVSVNRIAENKKNVAQQVSSLKENQIDLLQSQNTAELLSNLGDAYIQKSQLGGGSVVLRGFEASRTLLVVDGVRMNNLIYRSGHLQNIITTDNSSFENIEILYGPSSTAYGSDALGGVVCIYTKQPTLASGDKKSVVKINESTRYGSVNNEFSEHLDFNIGFKKFATFTSLSYSNFDDLKSGSNQNPFYTKSIGDREYYIERIDGKDSLIKNPDKYKQVQSGYTQFYCTQKFLFKQNEHLSHSLNLQYSTSSDIPRYDRLTDPSSTGLKYAEWYYGPQNRFMTAYSATYRNDAGFFQYASVIVNYQNVEESRHTRKFNNDNLSHRTENVSVLGATADLQKTMKKNTLRVGLDAQYNTLTSTASNENITTAEISSLDTRYPNGENYMANLALYISHNLKISDRLMLVDGIRVGYSMLYSQFKDTSFYNFPYTEVTQNVPVWSGCMGIVNNPNEFWKLSLLASTGYRVPNVDDLSKVFESASGTIIVPNPNLKPEKTLNFDLGITRKFGKKTTWENTIFYTQFYDAITTEKFTFNGQDSIMYDGELSAVYANQNSREAYIYGVSSKLNARCNDFFTFSMKMNYTYGRIKTDSVDVPLDHIPPLSAHLSLSYENKKFGSVFFINYNGQKKLKDYNPGGEDNEQYATEMGTPAWITANLHVSYTIIKYLRLQAGIDNIFDTQYRTFASGINEPGRNIFVSMKIQY